MAVSFLDTSHGAGESLIIWAKYRHVCHTDDMEYKDYTCPIANRYGGCELLAVPYPLQLKRKHHAMGELFSEVCEANGVTVKPVLDMDTPLEIYLPSMPAAA